MIKVLLTGGLGNQMFQYAFGRALSVKYNTDLVLSTSYLQSKLPFKKWATPMQYELGIFNVNAILEKNLFSGKILYPFAKAEYLFREKWDKMRYNAVDENDFSFQPHLLDTPDNSFIRGSFQSERYFKEIESVVRKELTFNVTLNGENGLWKNRIENSNAISIHIRRGDYIALKQNVNKFAQIPLSYYQQAMEYTAARVKDPVFFVFSDDISWVKTNLKSNFPIHFIDNNNTSVTSHFDMQLMAACKHHIICNSTFSWWGAWLNNYSDKIVVAPSMWFSGNRRDSKDIIPEYWIKL